MKGQPLSIPLFVQLLFFHIKTDNMVLRQLRDHPKFVSRLFLTIAVMQCLTYDICLGNYYEKKPCQLYTGWSTCDFTCALVLLPDQ